MIKGSNNHHCSLEHYISILLPVVVIPLKLTTVYICVYLSLILWLFK